MKEPGQAAADAAMVLKCELAGQTLRLFGTLRIRAMGTSMLPAVWPGDTLCVERAEIGQLSEGDIVLYKRDGRVFAHRVISIASHLENLTVITQGDAMLRPDKPVSSAELLGKVTHLVHAGVESEPRKVFNFAERLMAHLARRSRWAVRLFVFLHTQRRTPRERIALCQN